MENINFDYRLKTLYDDKVDKSIVGLKRKK